MRYAAGVAVIIWTVAFGFGSASAQTSVIQQNNISVSHEGSSVTVSGQTVSVDTSSSAGRIVGDGQRASQSRPIGPVTAIDSDGAFALTVRPGPPNLTIETDKNLLPIVKTEVANGRLELYADRSYSVDGRIKVTVTSPDLSDISASGSNEISADGLRGAKLAVSLNGSNRVVLTGNVAALTARLSGANHLAAEQLTADSVEVSISGSGNAAVNARRQIVAEISGAGTIAVHGDPKARSTQINGAGKISFE